MNEIDKFLNEFKEKFIYIPLQGMKICIGDKYDRFEFRKEGFFYITNDNIEYFESEIDKNKKIKLVSLIIKLYVKNAKKN